MTTKFKYILGSLAMLVLLLSSCQEEPVVPDTVPIKAEIKQVIVKNSIYRTIHLNDVPEDMDTVIVTLPQGTEVTNLDLDIIYSYFGSISPEPGVTDLTNPVIYTVTSNAESREVMVMANLVPPSITTFSITSPAEIIGRIEGDSIYLDIFELLDLSAATFTAEFFGEAIEPDMTNTLDLTVDNPTIDVHNKDFTTTYDIIVNYLGDPVFTGSIWDGAMHPENFLPGSVAMDEMEGWVVEAEATAYHDSVVHFTSIGEKGTDGHNGQADFVYDLMGLDADPNESTTVFRVKGISNPDANYLEIAFKMDELRAKFYIEVDNLEIKGGDDVKWKFLEEPGNTYDPTEWNTYRITCNKITREIKLYLNEEPDPRIESTLEGHEGGAQVKVGDGGSNYYECLIDYFAFETSGAFTPEDLPLEDIIN